MTYYLRYKEDGSFNGFLDETDYRVDKDTMINITEELMNYLTTINWHFIVDVSKFEKGRLYSSAEEILIPFEEKISLPEEYNQPNSETEKLKQRLIRAEQDNLTALEALAEVYEQLLLLQEQVNGGIQT